jgi:hypothetical protein
MFPGKAQPGQSREYHELKDRFDKLGLANPHIYGEPSHQRTGERTLPVAWILALAPLVLHFFSVTSIIALLLTRIHGHLFYVANRRPLAIQADGSSVLGPYLPLQSDILTAISAGITIWRIFAAAWCARTTWCCIFLLLED